MAKDKTSVMMDNDAHKVLTIIKATVDSCKTISDAVMYLRDNKKHNHLLYGASTGYGKSVALWDLIQKDLSAGLKVLVLAPRRKLILQLENTLQMYKPHVMMGAIDRGDRSSGLVLSSLQTTNSRLKNDSLDYEGFDKIYWDEAHLGGNFPPAKNSVMARLYNKYWSSATWIGFTATPITANGYRLQGWDKTIYKYQTGKLIEMGYLADYIYKAPATIDLSSLRTASNGEFVTDDIEDVVIDGTALKSIKKQWKLHDGKKKKCLIFAISIQHAKLVQKRIKTSLIIHSEMTEREQTKVLLDFEMAKSATLINVGILTTGYDDPSVDLLILARPIKSIRLAMQVWGRGLRLYGDKVCTILDMCSVYESCGLPKDVRDFNRVKGEKAESDGVTEIMGRRCEICGDVNPSGEWRMKRKVKSKFILLKYFCPTEGCDGVAESRKDLNKVNDMKVITGTKVKKLSYKSLYIV